MQLDELVGLCKKALEQQQAIEALMVQVTEKQKLLTRLEQELIPEYMIGAGLTRFEVDGSLFSLKKSYKARLTEEKAEAAIAWLAENGFGTLVKAQLIAEVGAEDTATVQDMLSMFRERGLEASLKNTVHANTLSSFVREQDEAGNLSPEMADLLSVYEQYKVTIKETK